jgi:hypothetical protein
MPLFLDGAAWSQAGYPARAALEAAAPAAASSAFLTIIVHQSAAARIWRQEFQMHPDLRL